MEIKPGEENIQSDYPVSSFDPCGNYPNQPFHQVVYSCTMYPVEPYQQLFPFQGGGIHSTFRANRYYQIEIVEGSDYAYMERTAYQDSFGVFHPREYLGSYLTAIRGDELSGTGEYGIYGNGTFIRENSSLYFIHFDNYDQTEVNVTVKITDLDSNITTYWYTKVVNPELMIVNQQSENDTLLHYYSKDVSIKTANTKFPCEHPGYGGCPPDNVTFKIEIIEGAEYGTIKNSESGEVNSVFEGLSWEEIKTNIFTYYAYGLQPDSMARVTIRHSSSDADIQPQDISFTIKRNSIPPPSAGGSIYFQMDKKYVMPSDTVNIHLLWINEVSDTLEFLPMQRFRVEIAEGLEYGRLVDVGSGIQGDDLNDAGVDLKLIIETEIPVDLAKITLVAQADVLRFNRAIRGTGELQQEEAVERNINNKKEPITPEFIIVGDHIVGIAEVIIDKNPFVVEITPEEISAGDTALITIKKQNSDGSLIEFPANQQFEIGMIDGCLLGKLSKDGIDTNYLYGVTQPIYFIADTNAGSGVVKVRVGLIEITEGNRSTKGRKTTESDEYCFLNTFQAERYKDAEILVRNECEQWICTSGFNKYRGNIEIREVREDYNNINYCSFSLAHTYPPAAGIFKPLFDEDYPNSISEKIKDQLIENFDINVCFDKNNDHWIYQILEDVIRLRAILDVCEENILSSTSQYIIHDIQELSLIPNEEVCLALENFESQRIYGGGGKYYLIAPVWAHEKVHKANFIKLVNKVLNMKKEYLGRRLRYIDLLAHFFHPECNQSTNNESEAGSQIMRYLNVILKLFVVDLKKEYQKEKESADNELTTQNHPDVQWKITEYKRALQGSRLKIYWKDCPYKE